jgi:hypothetical protein
MKRIERITRIDLRGEDSFAAAPGFVLFVYFSVQVPIRD